MPDSWADMIAAGWVLPPEDDGDVLDEAPLDCGVDASAALAALRQHER